MQKELTAEQLIFFVKTHEKFKSKIKHLKNSTEEELHNTDVVKKYFEFFLEEMLKSNDDSIRVDLPRYFLSIGFIQETQKMIYAMNQFNEFLKTQGEKE